MSPAIPLIPYAAKGGPDFVREVRGLEAGMPATCWRPVFTVIVVLGPVEGPAGEPVEFLRVALFGLN